MKKVIIIQESQIKDFEAKASELIEQGYEITDFKEYLHGDPYEQGSSSWFSALAILQKPIQQYIPSTLEDIAKTISHLSRLSFTKREYMEAFRGFNLSQREVFFLNAFRKMVNSNKFIYDECSVLNKHIMLELESGKSTEHLFCSGQKVQSLVTKKEVVEFGVYTVDVAFFIGDEMMIKLVGIDAEFKAKEFKNY